MCMLAARTKALQKLRKVYPHKDDYDLLPKLVAYFSEEVGWVLWVKKAFFVSFLKEIKINDVQFHFILGALVC